VRQFNRAVPPALTFLTLSARAAVSPDVPLVFRDTPSRETHFVDGCDDGELGDAIDGGFAPMGRASPDDSNSAGVGSCAPAAAGHI